MKMPRSKTKHSTSSHRHAEKQEKQVAFELGGSQTFRSGAGVVKGDVITPSSLMIDCKATRHESVSVTLHQWRMMKTQATQQCRIPALQIDFIEESSGAIRERLAIIPYNYLQYLLSLDEESS